jgi:hypothetical protein
MEIRKKTGLIIRRGSEYLVGTILFSTDLRWSVSPWDAWITRDRNAAERVSAKVGGEIFLFNPVAGQLKQYGKEN